MKEWSSSRGRFLEFEEVFDLAAGLADALGAVATMVEKFGLCCCGCCLLPSALASLSEDCR